MKRLYLLRHGTAEPYADDDAQRALVEKGLRQARLVARLLAAMDVQLDLVLCSPYLRARQTAAALLADLGGDVPLRFDQRLQPESSVKEAFTAVNEAVAAVAPAARVCAVGHEPLLSAMAAAAAGGGAIDLRKGGLVELEVTEAGGARVCGYLLGVLRPGHLEGLTR